MGARHPSSLSLDLADVPLQRWCFPWTLALVAGTSVCLRRASARTIYAALSEHGVTHMCGAPIIMQFIIGATARSAARLAARSSS